MADDYKPAAPSNMFVHEPLPYTVRLREMLSEDSIPSTREFNIVAYSVFEAWIQAVAEAGGTGIEDAKYKLEHIGPNVPHYVAMTTAKLFTEIMQNIRKQE